MLKSISSVISLILVTTLAACSGGSPSGSSGLVGEYHPEWSFCTVGNQQSYVYCEIAFLSENVTSSIVSLSDQGAYLVVQGRVYAAETRNYLAATSWNPGEKLEGYSGFNIPEGALIESFFYSPTQYIQDATLIVSVNTAANITE